MNLGNIHNLGLVKSVNPPTQSEAPDEERNEIRAIGKELFSNRTINWDKLPIIDRMRAGLSKDYETKIRDEFKTYIQDRLIKNMNGRVQTYLNNNLSELKNSIKQINDLSLTDLKELNSILNDKETSLAIKFFAEEKEKLLTDLVDRKYLSQEQANTFNNEHPEYQEITTREGFVNFRTTVYNAFRVPPSEQ